MTNQSYSPTYRNAMNSQLIAWFQTHGRDLPWRKTRNPYHILVAEIMLQQTQVDRVVPYYHTFLKAYPKLANLAQAPKADVIRYWAGLGYNRRAVYLQRAAQAIVAEHDGVFPQDVPTLRKLPGIGPYTAGAIACFAFEQDVAFLDTNMRRVVRRCFVGSEEGTPATHERVLLQLAEQFVPEGQGWFWNQALIELGALICTASSPQCYSCPLQNGCRAYDEAKTAQLLLNMPKDSATTDGADTPQQATVMLYPTADQRKRPIRRAAEKRESFIGSNRYYRGRVVDMLRALPDGATLSLEHIGAQIKEDYTENDAEWLRSLIARLANDGLVEWVEDEVRLPIS